MMLIGYFNGHSDTQRLVQLIVCPFDFNILEDQELKTKQLWSVTKRKWVTISVAELSLMDSVRLGSICLIEFDWFGNRTHTKFVGQF